MKVGMVSGKLVLMGENQRFPRSQDKQTALLPEIARAPALAESFFHGLDPFHQGRQAKGFDDPAFQVKGLVDFEVSVHIHVTGKMEIINEFLSASGRTAADGYQTHRRRIQFLLDTHKVSRLLTREHSPEMAQERQNNPVAGPQGFHGHVFAVKGLDG
jgi:hypothetical protein